MYITTTVAELSDFLAGHRATGLTVGFVPTMGALHRGHAELIKRCAGQCDVTVVSIFVNPTQFNDPRDLEAYPVMVVEDEILLTGSGCDCLFRPDLAEIYPPTSTENPSRKLDFGHLTERMEGAHRPGHFAGVAQVVSRLLSIVSPDLLFLGQKDYQQVAVIKHMIGLLALEVEVVVVPTVRETSGLAMSSRNARLDANEKKAAARISAHLAVVAAGLRAHWPARELERLAMAGMSSAPLLNPEYVEVIDGATLLPYQDGDPVTELVVATAVHIGSVRLIDNLIAIAANP